jgi:adenylate kinase family enzyme
MKRVIVIGSGGAGKSTFSQRLGDRTGLPVTHLDAEFWRPGWVESPGELWQQKVERLVAREEWILDGNFGGTMEQRIDACDTVIFLDLPRAVCLTRVVSRRIRFRGRHRPDMTPGCNERLTLEFLRWIWSYPGTRRPRILARLRTLRPDQHAVVLRSPGEVESFLAGVSAVRQGGGEGAPPR